MRPVKRCPPASPQPSRYTRSQRRGRSQDHGRPCRVRVPDAARQGSVHAALASPGVTAGRGEEDPDVGDPGPSQTHQPGQPGARLGPPQGRGGSQFKAVSKLRSPPQEEAPPPAGGRHSTKADSEPEQRPASRSPGPRADAAAAAAAENHTDAIVPAASQQPLRLSPRPGSKSQALTPPWEARRRPIREPSVTTAGGGTETAEGAGV